MTVAAVCAVLGLGLLPAAHAHTLTSGETFVHSHVTGDPAGHDGTLDHGDHHVVPASVPSFTVERTLRIAAPVVPAVAVLAAPDTRPPGPVQALDAPVIHGPPLRVRSLRAPPARASR